MKKSRSIGAVLATILLATLLASLVACGSATATKLKVVTTTSLLSSIVEKVGKDKVSVTTITAPSACPGEFDVKPSQIQATAEAALFLQHGWPGEAFVEGLLESADNPTLAVVTINLEGNWMTPPIQAQGVERVAAALGDVDPDNKDYYQANAETLLKSIQSKGRELKARLEAAKTSEVNVICSGHQADFVKWAGFKVIATYGRPADLTPQEVRELVVRGKEAGVALVIDNLQSGPEAGVEMAQEIGAVQVTLSNFPGGFEGTETWEKAVEKNVELLMEALAQYRGE